MQVSIKKIDRGEVHSVGAPKEILVSSFEWHNNGESGKTYTYEMSKERFVRDNTTAYQIELQCEGQTYPVATIGYYDLVDYKIEDCIGDRIMEQLAEKTGMKEEALWALLIEKLKPMQETIQMEFAQTEEGMTSKRNQQILSDYAERKRKFCMELGLDGVKYDRCYNVFGELMDAEYLNKLQQEVAARQQFSANSKRKHKDAWRRFSGSMDYFSEPASYTEEEREMLERFYKTLAKKFHPDANPGVDTSKEMQLLNQLKKQWNI